MTPAAYSDGVDHCARGSGLAPGGTLKSLRVGYSARTYGAKFSTHAIALLNNDPQVRLKP